MGDHVNLRDWIPMIEHLVKVDNAKSVTPKKVNVGTVRVCNFGGDLLTERITHWIPNKGYAYQAAEEEDGPFKGHLAVITIEKNGTGGSMVSYRQFFHPQGFKGTVMMPFMMDYVLTGALENLMEEFGGEVF